MKNLPVSKKVYADISDRITTTLSFAPTSAAEAMRLVDSYLEGQTPESNDGMAMIAFNMIRAELDRAISRSARARERARIRKQGASAVENPATSTSTPESGAADTCEETASAPIMLSRRERRAIERATKGKTRKWKKLGKSA